MHVVLLMSMYVSMFVSMHVYEIIIWRLYRLLVGFVTVRKALNKDVKM